MRLKAFSCVLNLILCNRLFLITCFCLISCVFVELRLLMSKKLIFFMGFGFHICKVHHQLTLCLVNVNEICLQ